MGQPTCTPPCPAPTCLPQVPVSPLGLLWAQDKAEAGGARAGLWTSSRAPFSITEAGSHHRAQGSPPRCSRPPDGALGIRRQERAVGRQSPVVITGSGNHIQESCSVLSPLFFCLHPVCPALLRRGGGSWGSPRSEWERGGQGRKPTFPSGALGSGPWTLGPRDAAVGC